MKSQTTQIKHGANKKSQGKFLSVSKQTQHFSKYVYAVKAMVIQQFIVLNAYIKKKIQRQSPQKTRKKRKLNPKEEEKISFNQSTKKNNKDKQSKLVP